MRSILGDVSDVSAHTAATEAEIPDFDSCLVASVNLRSGVLGSFQASWASGLPAGRRGVIASEGAVLLEGPTDFSMSLLRVSRRDDEGERQIRFPQPGGYSIRQSCAHVVEAIRSATALAIPIRDGQAALEVCAAMVESAHSGGTLVSL